MPISLDALNNAVSLAHQYSENSQCICNCIEILINDQYMMNQGFFFCRILIFLYNINLELNLF